MKVKSALILLTLAVIFIACDYDDDMHEAALIGSIPDAIYVFTGGNTTGNMGGRSGADLICKNALTGPYAAISATRVRALISVSELDQVRLLVPEQFWGIPVVGVSPYYSTMILSGTWAGLFDGSIDVNLSTAISLGSIWWTGSNADGTGIFNDNCSGWTVADATLARTGNNAVTDGTWIYGADAACNNSYPLLCIAY